MCISICWKSHKDVIFWTFCAWCRDICLALLVFIYSNVLPIITKRQPKYLCKYRKKKGKLCFYGDVKDEFHIFISFLPNRFTNRNLKYSTHILSNISVILLVNQFTQSLTGEQLRILLRFHNFRNIILFFYVCICSL